MRLQLFIRNHALYFADAQSALSHEAKHYLPGQDDDATPKWYLQIFPVRDTYGPDRTHVLVLLKRGKKIMKRSTVRVDQGGMLEIDTETDGPLDPVGDEFAAVCAKLPHLADWKWKLHRTSGPITTDVVSAGDEFKCNADGRVVVCRTTVDDMGDRVPATYVSVTSAKWVVIHRGDRVVEIHLWPGAAEETNEIVETVDNLS